MTERDARRTRSKAGRLLLLYLLRSNDLISYRGAQTDIADFLGVNRSTICKDLRELDRVIAIYTDLAARQPWLERSERPIAPSEIKM